MLESLKFDIMKQIIVRTFQQPDIIVDNESRIRLFLEFYSLVAILITADIPHCAQSAMIGLLYYYHDPWSASSIPFSYPTLSHGCICILLFFAIPNYKGEKKILGQKFRKLKKWFFCYFAFWLYFNL